VNPDSELARLMATFPRSGEVEWIGIRSKRRAPLVALDEVEAVAGVGLVGDQSTSMRCATANSGSVRSCWKVREPAIPVREWKKFSARVVITRCADTAALFVASLKAAQSGSVIR